MQQLDHNNINGMFSMWSVQRFYKQETKLRVQLSSAQEAVKRRPDSIKVKNLHY